MQGFGESPAADLTDEHPVSENKTAYLQWRFWKGLNVKRQRAKWLRQDYAALGPLPPEFDEPELVSHKRPLDISDDLAHDALQSSLSIEGRGAELITRAVEGNKSQSPGLSVSVDASQKQAAQPSKKGGI